MLPEKSPVCPVTIDAFSGLVVNTSCKKFSENRKMTLKIVDLDGPTSDAFRAWTTSCTANVNKVSYESVEFWAQAILSLCIFNVCGWYERFSALLIAAAQMKWRVAKIKGSVFGVPNLTSKHLLSRRGIGPCFSSNC